MRGLLRGVAAIASLAIPVLAWAQQQPDGFVPVDPSTEMAESLPAAPMVMTAYALVWVLLIGYLWSLRRRQARVELEMAALRARVNERPADTRQPR